MAFHYSGGNPASTPADLQDYAMDSLGYTDTHYNFFVDRNGIAYEGRGWTVKAAHARDQNTPWIGACFIGRDPDVTPAALTTMRELWEEGNRLAGRQLRYAGHGQLPGQSTDCPGSRILEWIARGIPREEGEVALKDELLTLPVHTMKDGTRIPLTGDKEVVDAASAVAFGLRWSFVGAMYGEDIYVMVKTLLEKPGGTIDPEALARALVAQPEFIDKLASAFAREMAKLTWRATPS